MTVRRGEEGGGQVGRKCINTWGPLGNLSRRSPLRKTWSVVPAISPDLEAMCWGWTPEPSAIPTGRAQGHLGRPRLTQAPRPGTDSAPARRWPHRHGPLVVADLFPPQEAMAQEKLLLRFSPNLFLPLLKGTVKAFAAKCKNLY